MRGRDESQILKLLATPPRNLDDMIYSVFKRLSQDPELDVDTTTKILIWVSFARRPLNFGELDIIARLYSGATNWMLWANMTGKFASIFRLRYPRGYNPDAVEQQGDDELSDALDEAFDSSLIDADTAEDDTETDPSHIAGSSDGDGGGGDDIKSNSSGESDDLAEFEKEYLEDGSDPTSGNDTEADRQYDWNQKNTIIEFAHARFRDRIRIEGDPHKRDRDPLPVLMNIHRADIVMAIDCFKMMRLANLKGTYICSQPQCLYFNGLALVLSTDGRLLMVICRRFQILLRFIPCI